MRYTQAKTGRVFVLRLEDGEIIHEVVESFSAEHNIKAASLTIVGGVRAGSTLVVGPEKGSKLPPKPLECVLHNTHEITGAGTLFPDENETPVLHMHIACGRKGNTITGCIRRGIIVWHVAEVVLTELIGTNARRLFDETLGFTLFSP